jgi:O-antigen/teichoic acid export membrane protein
LVWFAVAVLIEQIVLAFALVILYFKCHSSIFRWHFKFSTAKVLLFNSWPLILSSFAIMLYMRIDQVMIKSFLNEEAVGNYAVAVKISELWYFMPLALSQVFLPFLIESKSLSPDRYKKSLQHMYDLMVWVAVLIAIPVAIFSQPLTLWLYGDQYSESGGVLAIHIWSGIFVFLGVANGNWFLAENLQIYSFYRTIIGSIFNILLNLLMLPFYGIKGAALSTLISYSVASYFSMAIFKNSRLNFILSSNSFNPIAVFKRTASLKTEL